MSLATPAASGSIRLVYFHLTLIVGVGGIACKVRGYLDQECKGRKHVWQAAARIISLNPPFLVTANVKMATDG